MIKRLTTYISVVYFFLLLIVYPFYIKDGYVNIGNVKYEFFLWIGVAAMIFLVPLYIAVHDRRFIFTDRMLWGYLTVNLISFLCSEYKENAWPGTSGWYMGLVSQVLFVFIYLVAENGAWKKVGGLILPIWMGLIGSAGVFVLGILNRFSIYPIVMNGARNDYISTLGNINWYCGYWSVFALLGIGLFMVSEERYTKIILAFYCYLAVLTGVTQGSSSAVLVAAICLHVLLWKAFDERKWLLNLLELLMIAAVALQTVYWLCWYFPYGMQYDSDFIWYLMYHSVGAKLFGITLILWLAVRFLMPEYENVMLVKHIRNLVFSVLAFFYVGIVVVFALIMVIPGGIRPVQEIGLFQFNDQWGNSRGGIWKDTWMAFREMSAFQMLFGVGPDSYVCFLDEFPDIVERIANQFGSARLTNAHNEMMNIVINTGFFGLLFFVGSFGTAILSFNEKIKEQPVLFAIILSMLGYLFNNMVSFAQILSTPFVFLVMGLGAGLTKQTDFPNMIPKRKCKGIKR